jgi:hypothetical protein
VPKDDGPNEVPAAPVENGNAESRAGPLVPLYGAPMTAPGIQAFRRGNLILYTVRGEPRKVLELMGRLDEEGISEVVALITHHADGEAIPPAPEPEETE